MDAEVIDNQNPLRAWRFSHHPVKTQSQIATLPELCVTEQTVRNWENGRVLPAEHHLYALSLIMGNPNLASEWYAWRRLTMEQADGNQETRRET
ncbi:MAG: helix-turn-helix domain-containing protein [Gammaproteobacteria bacterium]